MIEKITLDDYNEQYLKRSDELNRLIRMRNNSLDPKVSAAVDMKIAVLRESIIDSSYVGHDDKIFERERLVETKKLQGFFLGESILSCDDVEKKAVDLFKYRFINDIEHRLGIFERIEKKDLRTVAFLEECIELFDIDEVNGFMEKEFSKDDFDSNIIVLKNLFKAIKNDNIKGGILVKVLLNRKNQITEKERNVVMVAEDCKNNFIKIIKEGILKGAIPESAIKTLDKLPSINVKIFDSLISGNAYKRVESGKFVDIAVESSLAKEKYESVLRHIINHELIHSISGQIIKLRLGDEYNNGGDDKNIVFVKSGLKIRSANKNSLFAYGRWADEGAVEWLNIKLFGELNKKYKDFIGYTEEVDIIEKLLSLGMSETIILEALFEGYDGDKPKRGIGEKMIKFINQVDVCMGEGSYARLNNQSVMNYVEEALFMVQAYSKDVYGVSDFIPRLEFEITIGKGKSAVSKKFIYYERENGKIAIGWQLAGIIKDLKMSRGKVSKWMMIDGR